MDHVDRSISMTDGEDYERPVNTDFEVIAAKRLSRRYFLGRSASFGAAAFLMAGNPTL